MDKGSVNLVCSSGGVRCFSYIGAYKKLQEEGLNVRNVAASSMGALIGILICNKLSATDIENYILKNPIRNFLKKRYYISIYSLLKYPFAKYHDPNFKGLLEKILGKDPTLGDLDIPFATVAIDLRQSELLTYSSETHPMMRCSEILRIATAIPPYFKPYKDESTKRLLIDAGIGTESPAWLCSSNEFWTIILKTAKPFKEDYKINYGKFLSNMVLSAAKSNDDLLNNNLENVLNVEINLGNQKSEDFNITNSQIEKIILDGYSTMSTKLIDFNKLVNSRLQVENIASEYSTIENSNRASFVSKSRMNSYLLNQIKRDQVFVSYSHKDIFWLEKFQTFFRPLEQFNKIKIWDDTSTLPGEVWREKIDNALFKTKVAFFIVTPNFIDSEFITKEELQYFINVSKKENVTIFWVAVSQSLYTSTPLADIECANNPKVPLDQLTEANQNQTITEICQKLITAMR